MEPNKDRPGRLTAQRALEVYVAICTLLILIILYGSFERTGSGAISGEVYVRSGFNTSAGK